MQYIACTKHFHLGARNIASVALLEHCMFNHCLAAQACVWSCKWQSKQIVNSNTKYKMLQVVIKTKQSNAVPFLVIVIWCWQWQHPFWPCLNSATFPNHCATRSHSPHNVLHSPSKSLVSVCFTLVLYLGFLLLRLSRETLIRARILSAYDSVSCRCMSTCVQGCARECNDAYLVHECAIHEQGLEDSEWVSKA